MSSQADNEAPVVEQAVTLHTRQNASQTIHIRAPKFPIGVALLFPGADGKLRNFGPPVLTQGNFLIRSRALFVERGIATVVMDTPSDQPNGMWQFRTGPEHRTDIAAVVAHVRNRYRVPVWLIGTSRGSISAANGATIAEAGADGAVLTSNVTREGLGEIGTLFDIDLANIHIPVLLTHHVKDNCVLCPFCDTAKVLENLVSSPRRELIAFAGGAPEQSDPCKALSHHGYLGIERQVVAAIVNWMLATPKMGLEQ